MSFLIVDDNAVMRRTIRHVVAEFAGEIIECSDGADALISYSDHRPDWVLMDIEMKLMDGLTATREICAAFPDARVAVVTNHGGAEMRSVASDAGACAFVVKENLLELRAILTTAVAQAEPVH